MRKTSLSGTASSILRSLHEAGEEELYIIVNDAKNSAHVESFSLDNVQSQIRLLQNKGLIEICVGNSGFHIDSLELDSFVCFNSDLNRYVMKSGAEVVMIELTTLGADFFDQ
ncbi:MAG: hypothetical protein R3C11_16245 [Planctomycetaceae bacterium]